MGDRPLVILGPDETRELLETARVGNIAYESGRGVDITPVNFKVSGDAIYIRTVEDGTLAELAPGAAPVVFLVTYLDSLSQTGWSVKVRGTLNPVDEAARSAEVDPEPWVGFPRTILLGLTIEEMTGRRVG